MVELQPPALNAIAVFYEALDAPRKRMVVCAPDCYERVRDQIENGPAAQYFDVHESHLLADGHVFVADPHAALPPWRAEPFVPLPYRCATCMSENYGPGLCPLCREFEKLRPPSTLSAIILGLL